MYYFIAKSAKSYTVLVHSDYYKYYPGFTIIRKLTGPSDDPKPTNS